MLAFLGPVTYPKRLGKKTGGCRQVRVLREKSHRKDRNKRRDMFWVTWEGSERDREKQHCWKDRGGGGGRRSL